MMRKEIGKPQMLIIGASHVKHLESFVNSKNTPFKYSLPFRKTFFLGVGGTKWETCLHHFQGKKLTTNNKHLGDQWRKFYDTKISPDYTIILLGSNSIDEFDRDIIQLKKRKKEMTTREFWKEGRSMLDAKLETLKQRINEALYVFKCNATRSEMMYLQILPRNWWHPLSLKLACKVDKYIIFGLKRRYRVKDFRPKLLFPDKKFNPQGDIMPGMLNTDEIHLNGYRNRALISCLIGSIVQKWLQKKGHKPISPKCANRREKRKFRRSLKSVKVN